MTTLEYTAVLEEDDNDTILATVPELPGVVSFGQDEADAIAHVQEALIVMFSAMMDDNEEIPAPRKVRRGTPSVTVPTLVASKVMLYNAMRDQGVTRAELARRLGGKNPTHITRLLNVLHQSRHDQIDEALAVLGHRIVVELKPTASFGTGRRLRVAEPSQTYASARSKKAARGENSDVVAEGRGERSGPPPAKR